MQKDSKGLKFALIVLGGATALIIGMIARDKRDFGGIMKSRDPLTGMLIASRTNRPPEVEIPERVYFEQMAELLKRDYVEMIDNDGKLLSGAVRGMVGSLNDPNCLYMDKDELKVFQSMRLGKFEGVGAELYFTFPRVTDGGAAKADDDGLVFPQLNVAVVAPGGPADLAGMKPGDVIDSVNGKWITNTHELIRFRDLTKRFQKKQATQDELNAMRKILRKRLETAMMPTRARDLLMIGKSGAIEVAWLRNGKIQSATMTRRASEIEPVVANGDSLKLHFTSTIAEKLEAAFPADGIATLDLRNNNNSDLSIAREILAFLAPAGSYGRMLSDSGSETLKIANGRSKAKKLTLIVDESTNGAAAIVARALAGKGLATVQGKLGPRTYASEVVHLPEGDGFTLVRAQYQDEKKS